jgi:hypothetical protein
VLNSSASSHVSRPLSWVVRQRRDTGVATKKGATKSADTVVLDVLAYEFAFDDPVESERKMRRRLRYYGLGPYQQARVDRLRRLKNEIQSEIHRGRQSRYFAGSHGKYAVLEDFDAERLIRDLSESYPDIPREEIQAFVPFAVYLYYLR